MFVLRVTTLIAATMTTGLAAGVFGLYQHTIMRGLARTDDRTFVGAFQAMDRAIMNPWFMGSFFGAAFIVMVPLVLDNLPAWFGVPIDTALASHLTFMIFGSLIVFFLIVEPHGLARLWSTGKEKLRLWPFPH